ncbi:MAG: hypothetical protein WC052_01940 [Patescibacteria group bacterium]
MDIPDDTEAFGRDQNADAVQKILKAVHRLRQAIWQRRPILGEIMDRHGAKTLYEYARDFLDVNPAPRLDERKEELIAVVEKLVAERINPSVGKRVALQLRSKALISTIDHHGPIDHPFFVNANLISSLPVMDTDDPDLCAAVVFSFASVSVNNASAYPRGILLNGKRAGQHELIRIPILPDRLKMSVVYDLEPFTAADIDRACARLDALARGGALTIPRATAAKKILGEIFANPDVLNAPDFSTQITKINFALWPKLFGSQPLDLIYIDIESIVATLLQEVHLINADSLLYRMLFDDRVREEATNCFDGIPGAFSQAKGTGTCFFWGIDEKHRRVSLQIANGSLTLPNGLPIVPWNPEAIRTALKAKKIFPSMLTCYIMVSLYYGMKCLGGFCQVHDLTLTKRAWQSLLTFMAEHEEAAAVAVVQTKELGGDGLVLAYLENDDASLTPATGIDLAIDENAAPHEHYAAIARSVTVDELMGSLLPEMYTVLYAAHEREADLTELSPTKILQARKVEQKIKAALRRSSSVQVVPVTATSPAKPPASVPQNQ